MPVHISLARILAAWKLAGGPTASEIPAELRGGFVELGAGRLGLLPRTVIRFQGRDGERLEVELAAGADVDLTALAEAFWHRGRGSRSHRIHPGEYIAPR